MEIYGVSKLNKKSNIESLLEELFETGPTEVGDGLSSVDENMLTNLENQIEYDINSSVDEGLEQISESSNVGGFAYETTVIQAIKQAGISGNITKGAGASRVGADANISINNKVYDIEVKLNRNAQMGGSSVRFGKKGIELVKPMAKTTSDMIITAVSSKTKDLNQLIAYLTKQRPATINGRVDGLPLACTTEAWTKARTKGLLVNSIIKYTTDFIAKHYAEKGIYYIQLGGAGLFYMSSNPANLPIPKLKGEIDIEIRSARSGSKMLTTGHSVVGGGIRVQARLKTKGISPYSADDPKSLSAMIEAMKEMQLNEEK